MVGRKNQGHNGRQKEEEPFPMQKENEEGSVEETHGKEAENFIFYSI